MMSDLVGEQGVQLPERSASKVLYQLVKDAVSAFPQEFQSFKMPKNGKDFSDNYHLYVADFEHKRAVSPMAQDIARFMADAVQEKIIFVDGDRKVSLREYFNRTTMPSGTMFDQLLAPLSLDMVESKIKTDEPYRAMFPMPDGTMTSNPDVIREEVILLCGEGKMDDRAGLAFMDVLRDHPDGINLKGQKFVLLGGTAGLSPLPLLLKAGADVLTTHTSDAEREQLIEKVQAEPFSGRLFIAKKPMDLLKNPIRVFETVKAFADNDPVHLGVFAYAPGQAREWRLMAAQDGIARKLADANVLKSVSYLLSPSVPTEVSDYTAFTQMTKTVVTVDRTYDPILRMLSGSKLCVDNIARGTSLWAGTPVPQQGASYAAANLIGKTHAMEHFNAKGIKVSANVAPISWTDSMNDPFVSRGLANLDVYGIKVYDPAETRAMMFLQMVHDLTCKSDHPALDVKHVHGGVFTAPYSLESCTGGSLIRSYLPGFKKGR